MNINWIHYKKQFIFNEMWESFCQMKNVINSYFSVLTYMYEQECLYSNMGSKMLQ